MNDITEIFLACLPGLEPIVAQEARHKGFRNVRQLAGGVAISGDWPEVWRANLLLRGPSRILARMASFRAAHLAELDKKSRAVNWQAFLRPDVAVKVEATCKASRIYHSGAAAERIARALHEATGAAISADAEIKIMARMERDLCTISLDTSGELLHKRGAKQAMAKAPMRETMAALFLAQCGYEGQEPVLDPMCGSGTFVLEAAEIASHMPPGRHRQFAFEKFNGFQAEAFAKLKQELSNQIITPQFHFYGSDIDEGAIRMAKANAERAGLAGITHFNLENVANLTPPEGPAGLVMINPPYGSRIGKKDNLRNLHVELGRSLLQRFSGWRVGLITANESLARATGLPFQKPGPPVPHGGLKVKLWQASL